MLICKYGNGTATRQNRTDASCKSGDNNFIYYCDDGSVGISRAKTMRLCSIWRNVPPSDKTN